MLEIRDLHVAYPKSASEAVRGVSFDCCSAEFALKGLVFYMVGRALLNYDNLTYEAQLNDYCSCFGAAFSVKTWSVDVVIARSPSSTCSDMSSA